MRCASLSEVPEDQQRRLTMSRERSGVDRPYRSGDYALKAIAGRFVVHYSTVSRMLRDFERFPGK